MVAGDLATAAPLLIGQLERSMNPSQLVALLEQQLRALLLLAAGGAGVVPRSRPGLHPHVVRKLAPLARRYDRARLRKIYADLAAVDVALKSSAGDAKTLLLTFLTRSAYATASLGGTSSGQRRSA
jgi:DNA polymerase III delta subunit